MMLGRCLIACVTTFYVVEAVQSGTPTADGIAPQQVDVGKAMPSRQDELHDRKDALLQELRRVENMLLDNGSGTKASVAVAAATQNTTSDSDAPTALASLRERSQSLVLATLTIVRNRSRAKLLKDFILMCILSFSLVILFVLTCCVCFGNAPFRFIANKLTNGVFSSRGHPFILTVGHPNAEEANGMVAGKWMVVMELYVPGNIKYFVFDSDREAFATFNRIPGFTPRIIFRPVRNEHMELRAIGMLPVPLDAIRKRSRDQVTQMVPGKWMVVLRSVVLQPPRMYAFDDQEQAEYFLDRLQVTNGILFDVDLVEFKCVGTDPFVLSSIRRDMGVPSSTRRFLGGPRR